MCESLSRRVAVSALLVLFGATLASGQRKISGTVVDFQGQPVAEATVIVSALLDPTKRVRVETNSEGDYAFENFHPGRAFRFEVSMQGFQTAVRTAEVGIAGTSAGAAFRQDITLYPIGSDREERSAELLLLAERSPAQGPYTKGIRALDSGDLDRARKWLEQAKALDQKLAPIDDGLAYVYHQLGEHGSAIEAVDRALKSRPGEADYLRIRYEALRGLGRSSEARATLMQLGQAAFGTDVASLFFNEGVQAVSGDDLELAVAMFDAALRIAPEMIDARSSLAKVYMKAGRFESALAEARTALLDRQNDVALLRIQHEALASLGRADEALEALDQLAEHDRSPRTANLFYNEGVRYFNAGDNERAGSAFRRALDVDAASLDALIGLAEVELRQKRYSECLSTIERIRTLSPAHPSLRSLESRANAIH